MFECMPPVLQRSTFQKHNIDAEEKMKCLSGFFVHFSGEVKIRVIFSWGANTVYNDFAFVESI